MAEMTKRLTVVGLFPHHAQAARAVNELLRAGFRIEEIGFVLRREDPAQDLGPEAVSGETARLAEEGSIGIETGTKAAEGAATGAVTGGVIGGLIGAPAALLIPGLGAVAAGGVLAATLGGATAGAAAGSLLGVLRGMGLPEETARRYEQELVAGRGLVTVHPDGRSREATAILRDSGALNVHAEEM